MAKEWGRYNVTVNTVAFGLIRTRLTDSLADGDATISVDGRDIKVGVNPDLLASMVQMIPLQRSGTPKMLLEPCTCSAYLNRTMSVLRPWFARVACSFNASRLAAAAAR